MRVLVTGANGFVGTTVCAGLRSEHTVRRAIRSADGPPGIGEHETTVVGEIDGSTNWDVALEGVDAVVHLAARVHVLRETSSNPLAEFRRVNTEGTEQLARICVAKGVRRFVFLSSIGVNGRITRGGPFSEKSPSVPHNAYAVSKWEAELALYRIAAESGLEVTVLRPPLVYGPGAMANFMRLWSAIAKGVPLPFGSVRNRRSFLYVGNLVDALRCCLAHPLAVGRTYLVSDGVDVSTPEFIRMVARAQGRTARLLPFPPGLIRSAGRVFGKHQEIDGLIGSLQIDSSLIRNELGWYPPFTVEAGLAHTASWYMEHVSKLRVVPR